MRSPSTSISSLFAWLSLFHTPRRAVSPPRSSWTRITTIPLLDVGTEQAVTINPEPARFLSSVCASSASSRLSFGFRKYPRLCAPPWCTCVGRTIVYPLSKPLGGDMQRIRIQIPIHMQGRRKHPKRTPALPHSDLRTKSYRMIWGQSGRSKEGS